MHTIYHLSEWDLSASVVSDENQRLSVSIHKNHKIDGTWGLAKINWSAYGSEGLDEARKYVELLSRAVLVAENWDLCKIMKYRYTLKRENMDPYVGVALATHENIVLEQIKKTNCELIGNIENLGAVN